MITVLAGGTGSVKLVRGLAAQENDVCVISNVGDNYWVYGMYVCPDIDTMVYGLADLLDSKRSWGIKNDSFNFLRQMEVFGEETWFRMGDRDAATNLMRTNMLKDGKNLGFITDWLCKKFAVGTKIIPMTDNNVETQPSTQMFWHYVVLIINDVCPPLLPLVSSWLSLSRILSFLARVFLWKVFCLLYRLSYVHIQKNTF